MTAPDRHADAQTAAVAHLDACREAEDAMGEAGASWEDVGGPAINGDWYCGECETCDVREILAAAWPHALAYAADLVADLPSGADVSDAVDLLRIAASEATLAGQEPPA